MLTDPNLPTTSPPEPVPVARRVGRWLKASPFAGGPADARDRLKNRLFVVPILIIFVVLFVIPLVQSIWWSFTDFNGYNSDAAFVGLRNYENVFTDPSMLAGLWFTLAYTLGTTIVITVRRRPARDDPQPGVLRARLRAIDVLLPGHPFRRHPRPRLGLHPQSARQWSDHPFCRTSPESDRCHGFPTAPSPRSVSSPWACGHRPGGTPYSISPTCSPSRTTTTRSPGSMGPARGSSAPHHDPPAGARHDGDWLC